jgi:hypothetical protein
MKHDEIAVLAAGVSSVSLMAAKLCGCSTCCVARCEGVMLCMCDVISVASHRNACDFIPGI